MRPQTLQQELAARDYHVGDYRQFTLYERKPRLISAAQFRDQVVHHALMNVIEAPLDRCFIFGSYACRKGKGVHAAVGRYQGWARRYPYALKLDVRRYFPSIDHVLLKQKLRRRIADARILELLDLIIDSAPATVDDSVYFIGDDLLTPLERHRGLPIGNLTSQFLANLYLDDLDHQIKEVLRVPAYLRYVDDLFLLGDTRPGCARSLPTSLGYLSRTGSDCDQDSFRSSAAGMASTSSAFGYSRTTGACARTMATASLADFAPSHAPTHGVTCAGLTSTPRCKAGSAMPAMPTARGCGE